MKRGEFDIYHLDGEVFAVSRSGIPYVVDGLHLTGKEPRRLYQFNIIFEEECPFHAVWISLYIINYLKLSIDCQYVASQALLVAKNKEIEFEEDV